jgi:hypothetical protein
MKQYGVDTPAHAMKRAWKYKFIGELIIFNFVTGHPALEKSYVICIAWLAVCRMEEK